MKPYFILSAIARGHVTEVSRLMKLIQTNWFMYWLLAILILGIIAYVMDAAVLLMILLGLAVILIVLKIVANVKSGRIHKP